MQVAGVVGYGGYRGRAPSTRHWCGLSTVVNQFGVQLVLEHIADLRGLLGTNRYRSFFRDSMGAVEYKIAGKKAVTAAVAAAAAAAAATAATRLTVARPAAVAAAA